MKNFSCAQLLYLYFISTTIWSSDDSSLHFF